MIAGDDATLGSMLALGVKPVGAAVNVNLILDDIERYYLEPAEQP
ncbi:hypothetical protein [Hoyosella altamirensis]|nr:hypothetical protein [Hoyosella altamirensis]